MQLRRNKPPSHTQQHHFPNYKNSPSVIVVSWQFAWCCVRVMPIRWLSSDLIRCQVREGLFRWMGLLPLFNLSTHLMPTLDTDSKLGHGQQQRPHALDMDSSRIFLVFQFVWS